MAANATELQDKFRKVKHDINNTLAVVMAIAELSARKPDYYAKLTKNLTERWPDTDQKLAGLEAEFAAGGTAETDRMLEVLRRFNLEIGGMFRTFLELAAPGPSDHVAMKKLADQVLHQGGTLVEKMAAYTRDIMGDKSPPPPEASAGFGVFQ